ncbi:HNH endonuclease [Rhizobium lentis]|uniref:HNH endonuclease n=1 Tax=Rhizobium lentis TaxID=1138194 RepID=UPI001C837CB7|nr:HNH endonuclease [Rhizobium lentis]MBX5010883.1 HNH endonuclease [Rhizobium lentis]
MSEKITQDSLKAVLHYDPDTGIFTRLVRVGKHGVGSVAGTIDDDGYVRITIAGKKYRAQRLAFLYMTGSFPDGEVDHEDRVRTNNAWVNLREATTQQNAANRGTTAKSGFKGVEQTKTGYMARIKYNGVRRYLGTFDTAEGAHAAYVSAANDLYGEFARAA